MSVSRRLRELLDQRRVKYTVLTHSPAYTAQEIAESLHTRGREVAKVVVVRHAGGLGLAVLPAHARVDLERLEAALGAEVTLATEAEFAAAFPDCELGAMPPFGSLYGLTTWLEESLLRDREIAFNAGTHAEAIRMSLEDYRQLEAPAVKAFAREPAGAGA